MVKRILLILIFIILLAVPVTFAFNISVEVQTIPNAEVNFIVLDRTTGRIADKINGVFNKIADENGKVEINYTAKEPAIKASISIKKDNNYIKFNGSQTLFYNVIMAGGINYINLLDYNNPKLTFEEFKKEGIEINKENNIIENNITENKTDDKIEEHKDAENKTKKGKKDSKITGFIISDNKIKKSLKIIYYTIGIIIVLGLFFLIFKFRKKLKNKKGKIKVLSSDEDSRIQDAEEKIKEAKKELDEIKIRKQKLKEAKLKFEKDKKELEKLES